MFCPNCSAPVNEGAVFCNNCGATLASGGTPAAPADTASLGAVPPPPAPPAGAWPGGGTPQGPAAGPPAKKKPGALIAAIIAAVLLLGGATAGVVYLVQSNAEEDEDRDRDEDRDDEDDDEDADDEDADDDDEDNDRDLVGFATADEAVEDYLTSNDAGDWVYQQTDEYAEGDEFAVYWAGPPNSEYVEEIAVEQADDGSWVVAYAEALEMGDPGAGSAEDEAVAIVSEFLFAVQEDRGMDAHSLTVEPFASDGASAQMGGGDFYAFEIIGTNLQDDGTVWVQTYQEWSWGEEYWEYWVVPTELGYRISDVRAW